MAAPQPMVTVIIPTTRRPHLIGRAVSSVLRQTYPHFELIVVVDGPNPETQAVLAQETDPRLRVICNEEAQGAGRSRNLAAEQARGTWLAFLDDDDEWLPEKLDVQLRAAGARDDVLMTCRCEVATPKGRYVWPRRLYEGREPVDEYLYGRRSFTRGEAYLATPTFMLPKALFMNAKFGSTSQHEDTTLLLRVTKELGAEIIMVPEVLTIIHTEVSGQTLGSDYPWRSGLAWAESMGDRFTRRGFSGFCLVTLTAQAKKKNDYAAIPVLLQKAFRRGSPQFMQLLLFCIFWAVPMDARRHVRRAVVAFGNLLRPILRRA